MSHPKPNVGVKLQEISLFPVTDGPDIVIGQPKDRWTMLFIYRGRHCPRCKRFLAKLNAQLDAWRAQMDVVVVSADNKEKALEDKAEFGWDFELCYGLSIPQMRQLGLYVSTPLSDAETTEPFAEPGAFAIDPDGVLMLVDISNGPAARPDLDDLLDGMTFNITKNRPARGTA